MQQWPKALKVPRYSPFCLVCVFHPGLLWSNPAKRISEKEDEEEEEENLHRCPENSQLCV